MTRPAGDRYARDGGSAGSPWPAGRSQPTPRDWARSPGARWNSPRSERAAGLGLEAAGPADLLRSALQAAAALMSAQALPGGVEPGLGESRSYAEWLCLSPGADRDADT